MSSVPQPVRIAFCENGAGFGGAIISLAACLEQLSGSFQPFLYTSLGDSQYRQLGRLGTWRQLRPWTLLDTGWLRRQRFPFASTIDNLFNVLPNVLRFWLAFKRDRISLVYLNNDPVCNLAAALAARLCGLPTVLHMRGFCDDTASTSWVLTRVAHCIAVSRWIRNDLLESGLDSTACTVVPEGLDLTLYYPRPADESLRIGLGLPAGAPVITLVGGLVEWKGQDVLLAACPAIFSRYPQAQVLLAGSAYGTVDGYAAHIQALADAAPMAGRVHVLGARSDVPALLALSSVVLHASTQPEPFGRTFLEGMAMGRPVIAAHAGGPVEVIRHGVDGLLIEPGNPSLLAEAVISLLDDPLRARQLGEAAALTAEKYSIGQHTRAIEAVLVRVLAGR